MKVYGDYLWAISLHKSCHIFPDSKLRGTRSGTVAALAVATQLCDDDAPNPMKRSPAFLHGHLMEIQEADPSLRLRSNTTSLCNSSLRRILASYYSKLVLWIFLVIIV